MIKESFFACFFEFLFLTQTELFARAISSCFDFHKLYAGGNLQETQAVHAHFLNKILLLHTKISLSVLCVCVCVFQAYILNKSGFFKS